ncbi:MAG: PHP domain-containing protein [Lachnoclostridium sp.]|jgi:predicted metal-dependent phosphoesterase TrpH|nr:PHP domain-containing protein [Lachnoclostridium sp.]
MGEFLYETHLHTSEGSICGYTSGREYVDFYKDAGFDGIIVTDHFFTGNSTVKFMPITSWEEKVEVFCSGYENAKKAGDKAGLKVFFGWESWYEGTEFLVYGLTKEWLLEHPEIMECSISEQYRLVHQDGGMVIHAHPFREAPYILEIRLEPDYVDGIEVFNYANHYRNPLFNKRAYEYAQKYDLPMTCGSDIHRKGSAVCAMCFEEPLHSIQDYMKAVRGKKEYTFRKDVMDS